MYVYKGLVPISTYYNKLNITYKEKLHNKICHNQEKTTFFNDCKREKSITVQILPAN